VGWDDDRQAEPGGCPGGATAEKGAVTAMAVRTSAALARWRRQAVSRMAEARASTLAVVARLPEREIRRPRTQDRWSVHDVLVHLLSCDEETLRRFRLIARGHGRRIRWFESMADADRFNARSVARGRRLGLRAVLGRMARVRAALIEALERLPLEALADPSHDYPVVEWLPAPGWSHERDHAQEIRAWWRATARAGPRPGARPRPSSGASPRRSPARPAASSARRSRSRSRSRR